jgi:uncharacterized membrane protein
MKKCLNEIKKFYFQNLFSWLSVKIVTNKKEIKVTVAAVVIIFFSSFLVEYFGFGKSFNQYRFLLMLAVEALATFFFLVRKKIGERPELGFLAVALICGSLLSFSEPKAYVSWDEQIHYKNAEKISLAIIGGFSRPNTVKSSYSLQEQKKINEKVDSQYKKAQVKSRNFFEVFSYNRVAYLPSAIALIIGGILHLPYHLIFIFGRWINLLIYAVVIYFAIRKLKTGKMIMSVVALFPTAIFLAANFGYDYWVICFTMLGLAYLFSEMQQPEKKITTKEAIIMIGSLVLGLGPKAIYFPLLTLLFFLKKEKFESLKKYKKFFWASIFSILFVVGSFMLPFIINGPGNGDRRGGDDVNAAGQVHFILSNPISYTKIFWNFMLDYVNPVNAGGFMTFFAYLGSLKGFYLLLAVVVFVMITDKTDFDRQTDKWGIKVLVLAIYLATVALIATALYVAFTAVANDTIAGVQPRYLIPLIFPLLFVMGSSRVKNPFNKNICNMLIFGIVAWVFFQGIWDLIIRNYY